MRFLLDPPDQSQVLVEDSTPSDLKKYIIPFSTISYSSGSFGRILSQEIKFEEYTFWYHLFFIQSVVLVHPVTEERLFTLHYMLKGRVKCHLKGFVDDILLIPERYQFYGVPADVLHDVWFEPGEYISFHFEIPPITVEQIADQYADFKKMMYKLKKDEQAVTLKQFFRIRPKMSIAIKEILSCREEQIKRDLFLRERFTLLLNAYLNDMESYQRAHQLTESKRLKLVDLRKYIEANLESSALLTRGKLASHYGLDPRLFHRLYLLLSDLSLNKLILDVRMEKAMEFLIFGKLSIHQIAIETGYSNKANFSRAFKKYYKKSPSSYLKT